MAAVPAAIRRWDIGAMWLAAIREARIEPKVAAGLMGISESQLSRQLLGRGPDHLSEDRLTRLPDEVWLQFYVQLGERLGLADDAVTRARREARDAFVMAQARLAQHDNAGGDRAVA